MASIDLNADLGEADHPDSLIADRAMMPVITSCNIACGGHIGNDDTMRATLVLAKTNNVIAGAHPAYPDRANFGRTSIAMPIADLLYSLRSQITALNVLALENGVTLRHIKPHGALYNDIAASPVLAEAIAACFAQYFPDMRLVGLAGGAQEKAASHAGLKHIAEAFADRRYLENGHLQPRSEPGSVIEAAAEQTEQAVGIIKDYRAIAANGAPVTIHAKTLCMHGDTPGAAENAAKLRNALAARGIEVKGWNHDQ